LYAYVDDALSPLETGVRRVERRVGKLRTNAKSRPKETTTTNNTIFVPAQPKPSLLSWLANSPPPLPPVSKPTHVPRATLDSIPEEPEVPPVVLMPAAPAAPTLAQDLLAVLLALALWPLHLALLPVRFGLRWVLGVL
jgi:hypothetical protein